MVHLGGRAAPEEALQSVQVFAFFYRLVFLLAGAAMTALRLDLASGAGEIRGVVPLRIRRISPVVAGGSTATTRWVLRCRWMIPQGVRVSCSRNRCLMATGRR